MAYDPRNTWILSRNKKGDNPKRPDYRGTVTIEGVEYELAGWIREKKSDGSKFMSGTVKPKQPKPSEGPKGEDEGGFAPPPAPPPSDLDDDRPF
jgi:hypothetical protein